MRRGKVRTIFFLVGPTDRRYWLWSLPDPPPYEVTLPTFHAEQLKTKPDPDAPLQIGEIPCRMAYMEGGALDKQLSAVYVCREEEEKVHG